MVNPLNPPPPPYNSEFTVSFCKKHVHVTVNNYWLSDFTDVFYTAIDFSLTSRAVGVQIIHLADVEELVS